MAKAFKCDKCKNYFDGEPVTEQRKEWVLSPNPRKTYTLKLYDNLDTDHEPMLYQNLCPGCFAEICGLVIGLPRKKE
jgi:hypothetical protein